MNKKKFDSFIKKLMVGTLILALLAPNLAYASAKGPVQEEAKEQTQEVTNGQEKGQEDLKEQMPEEQATVPENQISEVPEGQEAAPPEDAKEQKQESASEKDKAASQTPKDVPKDVSKDETKKPEKSKEPTEDTVSGMGRIKGISAKTQIKEVEKPKEEKAALFFQDLLAEDPFTFSMQTEIDGEVQRVLLETWFPDSKDKDQDKKSYDMKPGEDGRYGVEIPYEESGIYGTGEGTLCYRVKLQDASGCTLETSGDGSVQAYGGYLDGEYMGAAYARTLQARGQGLDVWGSFAVSGTTEITDSVRIHGDATLWLETQNGNPSLYLNGNTSVIGDGPQSKVILSRKLRLKNDAGGIAVQSGSATLANLSFSSEDSHIGGVSGQSHGIWGDAGTSLHIQNCQMSSQATSTIVGTYGNLYAENTTFQSGRTGIHFNGSFGDLQVHTKNCTFQHLDEGIQGGTLNGKRVMSLYLDGWNRFEGITREAVTVTNGEYVSFSPSSSTDCSQVGSGVVVTNCTKAAIRNARLSGQGTHSGIGAIFDNTAGEMASVDIQNFNTGLQTQNGSQVEGTSANIRRNAQGVTNRATYKHMGGEITNNIGKGVYHDGSAFWLGGGNVKSNGACDVYLESGRVIDWPSRTPVGTPRILTRDTALGTPLVRNQFNGAGNKGESYFAAAHGGRYTARGGDRNGYGGNLLVLSYSYNVTYDKNSSDNIGNMPGNGIKYWNEGYDVPGNKPANLTYSYIDFQGWDDNGDGRVDILPNQRLTANKDAALRAVWADTIKVKYHSNDGKGSTKIENVTSDSLKTQGGYYTVRENWGFTDYSRDGYTYSGFDLNEHQSAKNVAYKDGREDKISFSDMLRHAQEKDGVLTLDVYAIWDKKPEINFNGEGIFYEGTDVLKADLMKNVTVKDEEDGDITGSLKIMKIQYSEGRLADGIPQEAYKAEFKEGMGEADRLDTWFMALDKNDSPVIHKVVYQVTDSAGGTTRAEQEVKVKYNEFPEITAQDRYFTLEEAQSGAITEKALLEDAMKEGKVSVTDHEEDALKPGYMPGRLHLTQFSPDEFTCAKDDMMVQLEFAAKDSMGPGQEGKEAKKKFRVYVVKDGKIEKEPPTSKVRFVDEENYRKNEDKWKLSLSPEEKAELNQNGGLNVDSIWYRDPAHKEMLEACFRNEVQATYKFPHEDVLEIQDFIEQNGIGNTKDPTALSRFVEKFMK